MADGYHHGDLRRALLGQAAHTVAEVGPAAMSLRDLARRAGVSHAAPAHHFTNREGLFTALAVEGYQLLAHCLRQASPEGFDHVAVAYVRFALDHPGHYAVMHRPDLLNSRDEELVVASAKAWTELSIGVASLTSQQLGDLTLEEASHTAWALVHGLASLASEGAIPTTTVDTLTRNAARKLFTWPTP